SSWRRDPSRSRAMWPKRCGARRPIRPARSAFPPAPMPWPGPPLPDERRSGGRVAGAVRPPPGPALRHSGRPRHGGSGRPWGRLRLVHPCVSAVPANARVDPKAIERFAALAGEWWDAAGPFAPLHRFNPVRLGWMRESLAARFGGDARSLKPLAGLRVLDIG